MKLLGIGFIIGLGKILPGISGSVLAIRLGIYEKVIHSLVTFFQDVKKNIEYLGVLGCGFVIAILLGSKVLLYFFLKYELFFKCLFAIFILSGLPELIRKSNSWKITFLFFLLGSILFILPKGEVPISYIGMGVLESLSTIIPGLSGTAIYLSLGWYEEILHLFGEFYTYPVSQLFSFLLGLVVGGIGILKGMQFFLTHYERETYSAIVGFFLSSFFFLF